MTVPGCTCFVCTFLRPTGAGRPNLVKSWVHLCMGGTVSGRLELGQGKLPVVASRQLWRAGADVECRTGRALQPMPVPWQQLTCTGVGGLALGHLLLAWTCSEPPSSSLWAHPTSKPELAMYCIVP